MGAAVLGPSVLGAAVDVAEVDRADVAELDSAWEEVTMVVGGAVVFGMVVVVAALVTAVVAGAPVELLTLGGTSEDTSSWDVVAGSVVAGAGTGVEMARETFSQASNPSSALSFPTLDASRLMLIEDSRQRVVAALKEIDRQLVSAVHMTWHSSTLATFICFPIMPKVRPPPIDT